MPPLQALVALHGLWLLAFAGLARWIVSNWAPHKVKLLGIALCLMGLAGVVGLIAHDVLSWYAGGSSIYRRYIFQRALYVVGTTPDIPVLETLVIGMALWISARFSPSPCPLPPKGGEKSNSRNSRSENGTRHAEPDHERAV